MRRVSYPELIGSIPSLMYNPEVTLAVSQLRCFNVNPSHFHWEAAKWALQYLKEVKGHSLILDGDPSEATNLTMYSDTNWAEDINDWCSTLGYIALLGRSAISYSIKKQATVAASSTEVEYMGASYATWYTIWLWNLLDKIGTNVKCHPIPFLLNNKGSIDHLRMCWIGISGFCSLSKHQDAHWWLHKGVTPLIV
jgi:hypothetical protein